MLKTVCKWTAAGALAVTLLSGAVVGVGQAPVSVEAATKILPDNHMIEQLNVMMMNSNFYSIDVGKRKGTLLIRIDPPKIERDVEWLNHSITKTLGVNLSLYDSMQTYKEDSQKQVIYFSSFRESYTAYNGIDPDMHKYGSKIMSNLVGLQKFSSHNYPNYYIGLAGYLDKSYSNDGKYYMFGSSYLLKEPGQVKAYFFENQNVTLEAYDRIADDGTFPLLNKVIWGKTELRKGQLGKITVEQPTTLWKRLENGKYEKVRDLKVSEEYRVYRYLEEGTGYYGVGGGTYVVKNNAIKYETPSKKNIRLVEIQNGEGYEKYTSKYIEPIKENLWEKKIEDYKEIFPINANISTNVNGFSANIDPENGWIWHNFDESSESYFFILDDPNQSSLIVTEVLKKAGIYKGKNEALINEILRVSKISGQKSQLENIQMFFSEGSFYIYWGSKKNYYQYY